MTDSDKISGYGVGGVDTVFSVDEVARKAAEIAETIDIGELDALANNEPFLQISDLHAGYGQMEILHGIDLRVGRAQSLCLIGPNGAGKSTVLHAIFGFNNIFSGSIRIGDGEAKRDIGALTASEKLSQAGIAYILQDKSIFPGMTVEENLWMGGFLKDKPQEAKEAAEKVFDKYDNDFLKAAKSLKRIDKEDRSIEEAERSQMSEQERFLAAQIDKLELPDGKKVDWRKDLSKLLLGKQKSDGSWINSNSRWWENDEILVTSYVVMTLEQIYYSIPE